MKQNESGFTLIEVLVALLILSLAMGAILETINTAIRLRQKSGEGNLLPGLAQSQVEAIMAGAERAGEGAFESPWDMYHWRLWREAQGDGIILWTLRITRRERNGTEIYRLSTARLEQDKS